MKMEDIDILIRDFEEFLGFKISHLEVTVESGKTHDEKISLAVCHRFFGMEEELKQAIKIGNRVLVDLINEIKRNGRYSEDIYVFYSLVGNLYYCSGNFKVAAGYFLKSISASKYDIGPVVELLFTLRALGEYDLFEEGMMDFERICLDWRADPRHEITQDMFVKLITSKDKPVSMGKEKHVLGKIETTEQCNHDCLFCSGKKSEFNVSFEEINARMVELKDKGATEIMLSGGEPTFRDDLPKLIKLAFDYGFKEVSVQTNGVNLHNMNLLRTYLNAGTVKFDISFHSHKKEVFEKINGGKDTYEKFIRGLQNIHKYKIPTYFTIVINSLNYKDLKEQVMFVQRNFPSITHFCYNYVDPTGDAMKNQWIVPRYVETQPYMEDTFRYITDQGLTFRIEFVPFCFLNGFTEFSSEYRREKFQEPSYVASISEFRLRKKRFIERSNIYLKSTVCKKCKLNPECPGLNVNYANLFGFDELKPVVR